MGGGPPIDGGGCGLVLSSVFKTKMITFRVTLVHFRVVSLKIFRNKILFESWPQTGIQVPSEGSLEIFQQSPINFAWEAPPGVLPLCRT